MTNERPGDSRTSFEDARWEEFQQPVTYRHKQGIRFVEHLDSNDPKILDVGCGDGLELELFQEAGFSHLFGVDVSEAAVKRCREKGFQVQRANIEGSGLPFDDDEFDISLLLDVIEHLYQPEKALREVKRVSKHVGIVTPNFNSLVARLQVLAGQIPQQNRVSKGHVYWLNREELHRLLEASGLSLVKEDAYIYKQGSFLSPITRRLGNLRPQLFGTAFAVLAAANRPNFQ